MDLFKALEHIPLFRGLPPEQLRVLAGCAREKQCRAGQLIVLDTEEARALYLVMWGRVKIFKSSSEGKEQTIFLFGAGEPFCLTALTDEISPASAMALDDTRIIYFPADVLEKVVREEPPLLFNLLLVFSRRLKESLWLIESISLKELPQRLATFLIHSVSEKDTDSVVELGFSHRELAKILGATPESLSRVFKKLGTDGVLGVEGRKITIIDYPALARLAEE